MSDTKVTLVTVSDDRFGRKGGIYGQTQQKIEKIFNNNPQFGIDKIKSWTWDDIVQTSFYTDNKVLLDNVDAARNGRAYKPFVIKHALEFADHGDFVIYTDASPEMWPMSEDFKIGPEFNLDMIKYLCANNGGILSCFVKWDTRPIPKGGLGIHTHENFTTNLCMERMELTQYAKSFMHASGMMVFQKTDQTMKFVSEWLYYNCIDECCALGKADVPNDYSFWPDETTLIGFRHDQSISGLLMNKYNMKLVDIHYDTGIHTYNFLNFCRSDLSYNFIDSNSVVPADNRIRKGDYVLNEGGHRVKVYEIWPEDGVEVYYIGLHPESKYKTTLDKIKKID